MRVPRLLIGCMLGRCLAFSVLWFAGWFSPRKGSGVMGAAEARDCPSRGPLEAAVVGIQTHLACLFTSNFVPKLPEWVPKNCKPRPHTAGLCGNEIGRNHEKSHSIKNLAEFVTSCMSCFTSVVFCCCFTVFFTLSLALPSTKSCHSVHDQPGLLPQGKLKF